MHKSKLCLLAILIFIIPSVSAQPMDSAWPQFHYKASHGGLSPYDTSHVDGTILWTYQAGEAVESSPVIAKDGTIYFGSHDGYFYAIDSNGQEKWKFDAGPPVYNELWGGSKSIIATPAIASDGTVYVFSSADYMFALDPEGKEKWRFKIKWDNDFWSSPVIGPDGTIYLGSGRAENEAGFKSGLFAINPDGTEKWFYDTGNGVTMPVALASDGTIYFGIGIPAENKLNADTGEIVSITSSGVKKWGFPVELWVEGPVTLADDGTIYATTKEGDFYALTPDGKEKWKFSTSDGLSAAPAIGSDGTIYLGAWDCNLYALDPDGNLLWSYKTPTAFEGITSPPAIGSDGTIYVGSNSGYLFALNPNGTLKWQFDDSIGSGISAGPAIAEDGTVYIATQKGIIYALGCCGGNEQESCETVQVSYEKRFADPITCPKTNVCLRWNFDGTECVEEGDCSEGTYCNIIIKNTDDSGWGQFIVKSKTNYYINDIKAGEELSVGWLSNDQCSYWEVIPPNKMVCEEEAKPAGGGPVCGNSHCEGPGEKESCPEDCSTKTDDIQIGNCGDGFCEEGEACKIDCDASGGPLCGNGHCEGPGEEESCPEDCSNKETISTEIQNTDNTESSVIQDPVKTQEFYLSIIVVVVIIAIIIAVIFLKKK